MPTITSIKLQKSSKRVNIYLDDKFGFGLDLENFVVLNLKVNQELDEEQIGLIKNKNEEALVFNKVLNYATIRPRSEKEMNDYFRRKKINIIFHKIFFDKLKNLKLLDDLEFARWWIDQRMAFKSKSIKDLTFELRKKGVKSQIITDVLSDVVVDEFKIAKELVESKKYKWNGYDVQTRKEKIARYLASKGFGWDVINHVVDINPK